MANCITKHIPNTITSCNLICGCIAIFFAFYNDYSTAFLLIVLAAVFDFFDGMSARLLGVSSPIGKELDSLADVVSFGVAPSAIVFMFLGELCSIHWQLPLFTIMPWLRMAIPYFAFIMAAFSALRLAKFNLDERQTSSFIGVPTPANTLFWASLIVGMHDMLILSPWTIAAVLALVLLCSYLLIAELPLFALKFKHWGWHGNEIKYIFVFSCIPLLAILRLSGFAAIIVWYVVLSVVAQRVHKNK